MESGQEGRSHSVEIVPQSAVTAYARAEQYGLSIVGWYHRLFTRFSCALLISIPLFVCALSVTIPYRTGSLVISF